MSDANISRLRRYVETHHMNAEMHVALALSVVNIVAFLIFRENFVRDKI